MRNRGIQQYQQTQVASASYADPHTLTRMLFEGALTRIAQAKGALEQQRIADKCTAIGKAFAILDGLRGSLDRDKGGELAANLDDLYDYMQRRLTVANARNDAAALDEVTSLLRELKEGWDAIPADVRSQAPAAAAGY